MSIRWVGFKSKEEHNDERGWNWELTRRVVAALVFVKSAPPGKCTAKSFLITIFVLFSCKKKYQSILETRYIYLGGKVAKDIKA